MELQETTLGRYGKRLPLGIMAGNPPALEKAFDFRAWRWKQEKEIAKLRAARGGPGDHPGKLCATVLAHMLTVWGGNHEFQNLSHNERIHAICSAPAEDVLYAWIYLRREALGDEVEIDAECVVSGCTETWPWADSLDNLKLTVADKWPEPAPFYFKHPLELHKKVFTIAEIVPPPYRGVYNQPVTTGSESMSRIMGQLAMSAVHCFKTESGESMPPTATFFDEFTKTDIERLTGFVALRDRFPAIDLMLEFTCPAGHTRRSSIPWGYDFFYGAASLPREAATS